MQEYIDIKGTENTDELVAYAHALATKYGEASGALACEMYDSVAEMSGVNVPAAQMAQTATYGETAKAIYGTMLNQNNPVAKTVGRLVKQVAADTTLQNGLRDGAKFAWIPHGDTCAFCLMLASNGWQRVSKRALRNGHAEHIHPNCDCEYAISFDANPQVGGYDPDYYRRIYDGAEGDNWRQKINYLRREQYAASKAENVKPEDTVKIPEFVPAKSISEAEEFAGRFIQGGNYSSVDYSGLDINYANEFNRALNDVLSVYDPKDKLRDIKPMNMRSKQFKGSTADAAYKWGSGDLFFNKGYFKSAKDFAKHLKQYNDLLDTVMPNIDALIERYESQSGFIARKQAQYLKALKMSGRTNVSAADPYRTVVHELGHYLDDKRFRWIMKEDGFDISESFEQFGKKISAYAAQDSKEYVAESFLAYMTGERDIVDPALIKIFEKAKK